MTSCARFFQIHPTGVWKELERRFYPAVAAALRGSGT